MIVDGLDCDSLVGRLKEICEGKSGLSPDDEKKLRATWLEKHPFDLVAHPPGLAGSMNDEMPMDMTCIHRGPYVETGSCDLCCGEKGQPFEILACAIHGRCSESRKNSKVRSCVACEDRKSSDRATVPESRP